MWSAKFMWLQTGKGKIKLLSSNALVKTMKHVEVGIMQLKFLAEKFVHCEKRDHLGQGCITLSDG